MKTVDSIMFITGTYIWLELSVDQAFFTSIDDSRNVSSIIELLLTVNFDLHEDPSCPDN